MGGGGMKDWLKDKKYHIFNSFFLYSPELAQECDYVREAECGRRMREMLAQYPEYHVPKVWTM